MSQASGEFPGQGKAKPRSGRPEPPWSISGNDCGPRRRAGDRCPGTRPSGRRTAQGSRAGQQGVSAASAPRTRAHASARPVRRRVRRGFGATRIARRCDGHLGRRPQHPPAELTAGPAVAGSRRRYQGRSPPPTAVPRARPPEGAADRHRGVDHSQDQCSPGHAETKTCEPRRPWSMSCCQRRNPTTHSARKIPYNKVVSHRPLTTDKGM